MQFDFAHTFRKKHTHRVYTMDPRLATLATLVQFYGPKKGLEYERAIHVRSPRGAYDSIGRYVAAEQQGIPLQTVADEHATLVDEWASCVYAAAEDATRAEVARPEIKEGAIQCKRCHGRKTYYYQMQTRSADEGMSTFFVCTVCGARWRG